MTRAPFGGVVANNVEIALAEYDCYQTFTVAVNLMCAIGSYVHCAKNTMRLSFTSKTSTLF